ncbi:hypothetical protein AURDEDRAFT_174204 [Auricularia subglabra TFB-10046 SS5]|nr:hypothetical protein AURDEDRAFT_174204 [Auricularia subglabra TFB-10046 SS5]
MAISRAGAVPLDVAFYPSERVERPLELVLLSVMNRIRSLEISGVSPSFLEHPAPALEELYSSIGLAIPGNFLGGQSDCNLITFYKACDSNGLRIVELGLIAGNERTDVGALLNSAIALNVTCPFNRDTIKLRALLSGRREHKISVGGWFAKESRRRDGGAFPPIFAQSAAYFSDLHTLSIPLPLLAPFLADAPPVPTLRELRLRSAPDMLLRFRAPDRGFGWHLLHGLADVHVPDVVLHVTPTTASVASGSDAESDDESEPGTPWRMQPASELTVDDARAMMAELGAANIPAGQFRLTVRGFRREVAEQVDASVLAISLSFDNAD